MTLTCPSFFPGTTGRHHACVPLGIVFADNVHIGLVDAGVPGGAKYSAVAGKLNATPTPGTHCIQVTFSNGCTFKIGRSSGINPDVQFNETIEVVGGQPQQDLYLSGNNLRIYSPFNCAGAVTDNQAITLNAVLNVHCQYGRTDFRP